VTTRSPFTDRALAQLPYEMLKTGTIAGMIPYVISTRLFHTYRAITRRDSSLLFGAERAKEVRWLFERLGTMRRGLLLEVGDVLGPALCRTGFRVETVDIRPRASVPGCSWSPLRRDIRELDFVERYDAAVSISTLEHIGMGHYGDDIDPEGDIRSVARILRSLKPNATLLATVPLASCQKDTWQRQYTIERLSLLFADFRLREVVAFQFRWIAWRRVPSAEPLTPITFGPTTPEVTSIACVVAERPS
jgi:Caenorhabditis protein of unknown function, DUF268